MTHGRHRNNDIAFGGFRKTPRKTPKAKDLK
jgi:hypothetical protein